MKNTIIVSVFASLSMIACTDVKSSSVMTDGMFLDYSVVTLGEGFGSEALVVLKVGGVTSTTFVDLDAGDQLAVSTVDESKTLNHSQLGVWHSYTNTFSADTVDSEFSLAFDRADLDSAPSSVAVLPDEFSITEPVEDAVFSRSADAGELVIKWDNESTYPMSISVDGDCFSGYNAVDDSDAGTHIIPLSYFSDNEYNSLDSCSAEISVQRQRVGSLDPAFGGGQVYGAQKRTVKIRIDP